MTSRILRRPEVSSSLVLLTAWIEAQMAYGGLPGLSIGIVYDQTLLWTRGFGFADLETKKSATAGTIYRIASILQLCPDDKIAAVVLTNADDGNPLMVMDKVFQWVVPAIVKAATLRATAGKVEEGWQQYVGKYRNVWGDTQVLIQNGGLAMLDPSLPDPELGLAKLAPVGEHSFRIDTEANFGNDGEIVVSEMDERGDVTRIKIGNTYTYRIADW